MTQEEIIEMARQAGFVVTHIGDPIGTNYDRIEIFAKLVAEKEREACALVCDEIYTHSIEDWEGANWCGDAIRARGEA